VNIVTPTWGHQTEAWILTMQIIVIESGTNQYWQLTSAPLSSTLIKSLTQWKYTTARLRCNWACTIFKIYAHLSGLSLLTLPKWFTISISAFPVEELPVACTHISRPSECPADCAGDCRSFASVSKCRRWTTSSSAANWQSVAIVETQDRRSSLLKSVTSSHYRTCSLATM
jgi:hypothetical protein